MVFYESLAFHSLFRLVDDHTAAFVQMSPLQYFYLNKQRDELVALTSIFEEASLHLQTREDGVAQSNAETQAVVGYFDAAVQLPNGAISVAGEGMYGS